MRQFTLLRRFSVISILLLICSIESPINAEYPMVRNFSREQYGGGSQMWGVSQDADGRMYFANKYGLLCYDGSVWSLFGLPNGSEVRSVFVDKGNGRIYVGGHEEFGYFYFDRKIHTLNYHSLSKSLEKLHSGKRGELRDVWKIVENGGDVWFQSEYTIYKYNGRKLLEISSGNRVSSIGISGNEVVVGGNGWIGYVKGGRIIKEQQPLLQNCKIVEIITDDRRGESLILTDFGGLYLYRKGSVQKFERSYTDFIINNQAFCGALNGNILAIGTVSGGLVIDNFEQPGVTYLNRETGLKNNTVLSLGFDSCGNIWTGLDNGLDCVDYSSPIRLMLGAGQSVGTGYASMLYGNQLLMATNQGLYKMSWPQKSRPEVEEPEMLHHGQVWDICRIENDILICADAGLYQLKGAGLEKLDLPGTWTIQSVVSTPGYAVASTYKAYYLLKKEGGDWKVIGEIAGFKDLGGFFKQDRNGDIWLAHWMKGVYRMKLSKDLSRFERIDFYNSSNGLPSDKDNKVCLVEGEVVFSTADGFYKFDKTKEKFVENPKLNSLFGKTESGLLIETPERDIWNVGRARRIVMARAENDGGYAVDSVTFASLASKFVRGFESMRFHSRNEIIVAGLDGFYIIDPSKKESSAGVGKVIISEIRVEGDSLIYAHGDKDGLKIPYKQNNIKISVALPEYRQGDAVDYSFKLEGYDKEWSALRGTNIKEYTGLHEGKYKLEVRALNRVTRCKTESSFEFEVLPPFYRTVWAKSLYAVMIILSFFYGRRYIKRTLERKQKVLEQAREDEMERLQHKTDSERLKQEIEISELRQRQLSDEVKHKSAELNSAMLNLARKNEILISLSDSLTEVKRSSGKETRLIDTQINRIQTEIRNNINRDNDWKKFAHHFDSVYTGFIERLQERHPDLTRTELRVCCYLRMGLNSKDIAPLFRISYRSVEMTRYRVRKKLELDRATNLTTYLEKI